MTMSASVPGNPPQSNVIWILSDQHRVQAMSCTGDPNACTPNLDRMYEEGMSFTRAVSGSPLCSPFRASLISGLYPHRCGVPGLHHRMPPGLPTVATVFNDQGYDTAYFGKWHLDGNNDASGVRSAMVYIPPERRGGFRHWEAYENNNSQWDCYVHGGDPAEGTQFHERLNGYETDALTDRLIRWLEKRSAGGKNEAQPFFAVLSVQPPHMPYVAPERFMGRYNPARLILRPNVPDVKSVTDLARRQLAGYYAMIENVDWNVGRLREALRRTGLDLTTHLMYFSDHGDMHGSHGHGTKLLPYAESIDIPMILGGHVPRGVNKQVHQPKLVNHIDIAPTTLGLCGIDKPSWMPGCDYSGYRVPGRVVRDEPDSAYLQLVEPLIAGRTVDRPWRGVVTVDGWKYVAIEGAPWLMFNLNDDPYEQVNLALMPRFIAERKRLQDRLAAWISDTGDSFRLP